VYSDSYPLIGRGEDGDEDGEEINHSSEGVVTENNHSSSSSSFETIEKEGVISPSSSSSAIVSNSALNDTIEKVDDKMEHTLPASIAVETREKTIDELSREANANREAILDALMAQYGFEDGDGGGGDKSRSRKASISKQKEKKEKRVIPRRSVKRKRSLRIRKPTDFFGRSSDMFDDEEDEDEEEEEEEEKEEEEKDEEKEKEEEEKEEEEKEEEEKEKKEEKEEEEKEEEKEEEDNNDDDEDPCDSDATEPFFKIRKLTATSFSSSSS